MCAQCANKGELMSSKKLDPQKLLPADAAMILSKAGGQEVTEAHILQAIEAGAPVDEEGRIHLTHLAAWLLKEMKNDAN